MGGGVRQMRRSCLDGQLSLTSSIQYAEDRWHVLPRPEWKVIWMPKVRDITREVLDDGWYFHSQEGSHKHYKHPTKTGKVTIAGEPGDDLPRKTVNRIRSQAQLPKS